MRWPRRGYAITWHGIPFCVGQSLLLARDGPDSGRGRFLYRTRDVRFFLVDMGQSPPTMTVGEALDPYRAYAELAVRYFPEAVAIPPGAWDREWGPELETLPVPQAEWDPVFPRGLEPGAFPRPEPPAGLRWPEAVIGGYGYRVEEAELIAGSDRRKLYRTPGGRYFAVSRRGGRYYVAPLSPLAARRVYDQLLALVRYEEAFPPGMDWWGSREDGWEVPALEIQPPPPGLLEGLPDFVAYGRDLRPRELKLLAWDLSRLGTGERVLEALFETPDGEYVELVWAGGGDYRALEWEPSLARYSYERLGYKAVAPGDTRLERPITPA